MRRFSNWKKYQCQGQIFFLYIKWARYAFTPLHASHSVKRFTRSPSCSFDVSHGSIVMEFIWAFSTGDRCAIYGLKPFFLGGALGKSCARLAFHCCFLLLLLQRLYTRKPESCTVLQITWWCPERLIIELPIIQEICRILKIIIRKF